MRRLAIAVSLILCSTASTGLTLKQKGENVELLADFFDEPTDPSLLVVENVFQSLKYLSSVETLTVVLQYFGSSSPEADHLLMEVAGLSLPGQSCFVNATLRAFQEEWSLVSDLPTKSNACCRPSEELKSFLSQQQHGDMVQIAAGLGWTSHYPEPVKTLLDKTVAGYLLLNPAAAHGALDEAKAAVLSLSMDQKLQLVHAQYLLAPLVLPTAQYYSVLESYVLETAKRRRHSPDASQQALCRAEVFIASYYFRVFPELTLQVEKHLKKIKRPVGDGKIQQMAQLLHATLQREYQSLLTNTNFLKIIHTIVKNPELITSQFSISRTSFRHNCLC